MNIDLIKKDEVLLIGGQSISRLGDSIQKVASLLLIYTLTDSSATTGMLALVSTLPKLLFGFYAGAFADIYERKKIIVISDIISLILYISVPLLDFFQLLSVKYLFVIMFLIGVSRTFFYPALKGIIPEVVEKERLSWFNSTDEILTEISTMAGPLIAGILSHFIGNDNLFLINGVTFIVSVITVMNIKVTIKNNKDLEENKKTKISTIIVNGFKYVYNKKIVLYLILVFPLFTLISAGLTDIALLPFVEDVLGKTSVEYGMLESAISVGVFIGGFISFIIKKMDKFNMFLVGIIGSGLVFFVFGINDNYYISLLILVVLGIAFSFLDVCMVTLIQENVEESMLGRIFGLWSVLACGGDAVSYLYISMILAVVNVRLSFILGGIILLLLAIIGGIVQKKFKRVEAA